MQQFVVVIVVVAVVVVVVVIFVVSCSMLITKVKICIKQLSLASECLAAAGSALKDTFVS